MTSAEHLRSQCARVRRCELRAASLARHSDRRAKRNGRSSTSCGKRCLGVRSSSEWWSARVWRRDAVTSEERLPIVEKLQREIVVSNTGTDGRPLPLACQPESRPTASTRFATRTPIPRLRLPSSIRCSIYSSRTPTARPRKVPKTSEVSWSRRNANYAARLAEAENRLAQFRRDNFDRLPSTQEGYFERLQTRNG